MSIEYDKIAIVLSESWLDESVVNSEVNIQNYMIYRSDRKYRIRGGVCMYIRSNQSVSQILSFPNVAECLVLRNDTLNCLLYLGGINNYGTSI